MKTVPIQQTCILTFILSLEFLSRLAEWVTNVDSDLSHALPIPISGIISIDHQLQQQKSTIAPCHRNRMGCLSIVLTAVYLAGWKLELKSLRLLSCCCWWVL